MRPTVPITLLLPVLLLACHDEDTGWFIISQPSKGGLTIGIIKKGDGSPSTLGVIDSGGRTVGFEVRDGDGTTRWYAVLADSVLVQDPSGLVLRHASLPGGERRLPPTARLTVAPDLATLFRIDLDGRHRLLVHAHGNLVVEEGPEGIVAHGAEPSRLPPGSRLRIQGHGYWLEDRFGGLQPLVPPEPPQPEDCMAFVPERAAVQILDRRGGVLAELPAAALELRPEGEGLLLTGRFPQGLAGVSERPFSVLLPRANRNLVLLFEH